MLMVFIIVPGPFRKTMVSTGPQCEEDASAASLAATSWHALQYASPPFCSWWHFSQGVAQAHSVNTCGQRCLMEVTSRMSASHSPPFTRGAEIKRRIWASAPGLHTGNHGWHAYAIWASVPGLRCLAHGKLWLAWLCNSGFGTSA